MAESLVKAAIYASLLLALGAVATRWTMLPRAGPMPRGERDRIERALAALFRRAAMVLVAALFARLLAHTAASFGAAAMFDGARLRLMATGSRWGASWRVQLIAGGALLGCAVAVRPPARVAWIAAALASLAAVMTVPLLGHAAGSTARLALHAAHILGAGLWLGTLGVLVLVPGPPEDRGALLRAFSPLALTGAALVIPTGVTAAWLYLGSVPALWTTPYGRALTVKVALVAATMGCGYWNWQRFRRERDVGRVFRPADHRGPEGPPTISFATLAVLEAALSVAIVLVTGWLTELAHP
jgi:putative copper export protein